MEIITAKSSKTTLEKIKVTQIVIGTNDNSVTIQGDKVVIRVDNKEIVMANMQTGLNIQPSGSAMPSNPALTAEELEAITAAKNVFLDLVQSTLESKATVV